jgi:GTP-binding protein LepA
MVRIGDTITKFEIRNSKFEIPALPGYAPSKPMVFVSFYPQNPQDFDILKDALAKLKLNDPSFEYEPESHEALGRGFRCGFLGVLHSEIISERLQREYEVSLVISRPSVEFRIINLKGKELSVKTAAEWPEEYQIQSVKEPWVWLEIVTPVSYYSQIVQLLGQLEGNLLETSNLSEQSLSVVFETPLREIVIDFYDKLKSATQGMASMDYQLADWRNANLVKLEVHIAGRREEAFSAVVARERAYREGKELVEKLKELLPSQLFAVPIQAVVEGKVIARETMKARRRDVTAPLYGGDVTRKRKLLEKQKKGKKELAEKGRVHIPSKVFLDVFRS